MKKKIVLVIFILILIVFVSAVLVIKSQKKQEMDEEKYESEETVECIQAIYGMVKWQELLDKYDISYDEDIVREMKKDYISIINNTDTEELSLIELVRIIYINSKWNVAELKKYEEVLEEYYDKEKKIFYNYKLDSFENYDDLYEQGVEVTYMSYKMLSNLDVDISKYDILDGLKEYYIKSDDSDMNTQIIYVFFQNNKLNEIDYKKEREHFQNIYNEWLNLVREDDYIIGIADYDIFNFISLCERMEVDTNELKKVFCEYEIDYNDDEIMFPFDETSLTYPNEVMIAYWDVLFYQYGFVEMNDRLGDKLSTRYNDYYNNILRFELKPYTEINK